MSEWQVVVLGVLQALAEFLPISSSGHLIVGPALLAWPPHGLALDVALHVGTALALLLYFWRESLRLLVAFAYGLFDGEIRRSFEWRFFWLLAPAVSTEGW